MVTKPRVVYSDSAFALSAGRQWADEWVPKNGTILFTEYWDYSFSSPMQLLYYPPHGCSCVLAASGYLFVTGAVWTTKTWTVDDNGPADFSTIGKAIDPAAPGDTILVSPGFYSENVNVYKTLALLGQNETQTIIKGNSAGVIIRASNVTVNGFTFQGNGTSITDGIDVEPFYAGPFISPSCGENISSNIITGSRLGINLHSSSNNIISTNTITNSSSYGIFLNWGSDNNRVCSNIITTSTLDCIDLIYSSDNNISSNYISNSAAEGIALTSSSNNSLCSNTISNSTFYGIFLFSGSSNNSVSLNTITNSGTSIYVEDSNNSVSLNNITKSNNGIYLTSSNNNSVSLNNITNSASDSIFLGWSNNSRVYSNNITNSSYGILIANCNNNSVSLNAITNGGEGIDLLSSSNNYVSMNNITKSNDGIYLTGSNNSVSLNNITNNTFHGIYLYSSSNNSVSLNNVTKNYYGIELGDSSSNLLFSNNVTNSSIYGVYLYFSFGNIFFHNNFIGNKVQAHEYTIGSPNVWDEGSLIGGNFWSDYNGTDSNHDGIGDTPYVIDANNTDRYPLMSPWMPAITFTGFSVAKGGSGYTTPVVLLVGGGGLELPQQRVFLKVSYLE